jgi:hypothetical protein
MAAKTKKKSYTVWRWYRVAMSRTVDAETLQEAAQKLSELKYDDFSTVEDTESTDEEFVSKIP